MTAKEVERARQTEKRGESRAGPPLTGKDTGPTWKVPSEGAKPAGTGQPGGGQGRVDVTGIMPEGIRVDPNLTGGHPGYQESGDSEIIPTRRLTKGGTTEEKDSG